MTYQDIYKIIDDIGFPSAYYQFTNDTAQAPPFICFFYDDDDDLMADNSNYQKISNLMIELYTNTKDFQAERQVEAALRDSGLTWGKSESFIDSEKLHMTLYQTEVLINE